MKEQHNHQNFEPSEELIEFLSRMLEEFSRNGWGQPGSITELGQKGNHKHCVNHDVIDPIDFIQAYHASPDANGLMLHWEYWPDAEILQERPDAEIFRTILWADKTGNLVALLTGSASCGFAEVKDAFGGELNNLANALFGSNNRKDK